MNSGLLHEVVDSDGETLHLSELIGKGGEGSVFAVEGKPTLATKIFHQSPLTPELTAKLQAMVAHRTQGLDGIAAWPRSIVYAKQTNEPCGIASPRVRDSRHLHELYGTSARRRFFPQARWFHMVLAARNVAAAFQKLHDAGIVVGDVNQGNLLIDELMRVRFIDCDSFQIRNGDRTFVCSVGTPHFTPPELQGVKLRDVERTLDHDRFGLAILLFHLLFVGRHPFAGRFYGDGDQTIERAIAERRFAFSKDRSATLMEPPPASLRLEELPPLIGQLFEQAFRQVDSNEKRPAAQEWVEQLDSLLTQRQGCSFDPAHLYYNRLMYCPWCRIENEGGPAFFLLDGSSSIISPKRVEHLDAQLRRLKFPSFPELSRQRLRIPQPIALKRLQSYSRLSSADAAALALVGAGATCLIAPLLPWALMVGTVGSLASGLTLIISNTAKANRREQKQLTENLIGEQDNLHRKARAICALHSQRQKAFEELARDLKAEASHYRDADKRLNDVLALFRATQLNQFLSSYVIADHMTEIPGMTPALASVLQSYGIENPLDVDRIKLLGVPMIHDDLILELNAWRDRAARQFVFRPEHGVSFSEADGGSKAAVMKFKVAQARRILMASHHLDSLAEGSHDRLERELAYFERSSEPVRDLAKKLRAIQSARRPWERRINRSPLVIAIAALAGPVAGSILYWLLS